MILIFFPIGLIIGCFLNTIINNISLRICMQNNEDRHYEMLFVCLISVLLLSISFLRLGFTLLFLRMAILDCILIIISAVDYRHKIIPDFMVFITLIIGMLLIPVGDVSLKSAVFGMFLGGGILFLLSLLPGAIGGGDIKFMFAAGSFLGVNNEFEALFLAFISAAIISSILLLSGVKERKDHIPLGPFLALGCFISLLM